MIKQVLPDAILTKESGSSGFFEEKTAVALQKHIPVYVIKRPVLPDSFCVSMENLVCGGKFIVYCLTFLICIVD